MITNKLKQIRERRMAEAKSSEDWTQEGIAKRLGVTRQTIISMEKGTYNPSLELAFKIAQMLRMRIEDIFEYRDDKK